MGKEKVEKNDKNKEEIARHRRTTTGILTVFALMAGSIVFAVLCLHATDTLFLRRNALLFSVLSALLLTGFFLFSCYAIAKRKETLYKMLFSIFIVLLFCLALYYVFLKTGFFQIIKDENSLREYLEKAGVWMPIFYILLQFLQVVVLPIPSLISTLAGIALFGPFKTLVYSLMGILAGSFAAFFIGRKLGKKAVSWLIGAETLRVWQRKLKGKDNIVLSLMFLLPLFPDDLLCFVAGLSSMSNGYFTGMIILTRVLSLTLTCYSVDLIPFTTWWGLVIWGILLAVLVVSFLFIYKNLDKIQAWLSKKFKIFRAKKK